MKSFKALFAAAVVAATAMSATGCSAIQEGQARYDANPAAYETITGQRAYMDVNPAINVHGS